MSRELLDEAKAVGAKVLESEELDEVSALKLDMQMDELERYLPYFPKRQERKSIKVVIDGVELTISKDNCNATILELFQDIVYNRQLEKITQYLKSKYPKQDCLLKPQAQHELMGLELPTNEVCFEFSEIAEIIAEDIVEPR